MKALKILSAKNLTTTLIASSMVLFASPKAIASDAPITVIGELLYVVCANSVKVRGDNLQTVVFQADGYERVKPFQGWGKNKKKAVVNGQTYEFVKVQFLDNTNRGQAIGWIAEQFLKLKSECPKAALPAVSLKGDPLKNIKGLSDQSCCLFPLKKSPNFSYRKDPARFGARRDGGGRTHAAADLYTDLYQPILSVAPGKVLRGPTDFYMRTYQVTIKHTGGFIVRYGEIAPHRQHRGRGIESGATVKTGQILGKVGQCINTRGRKVAPPMLHFELYSGGLGNGVELTQRGRGRFERRSDLIDPTRHLEKWERAL